MSLDFYAHEESGLPTFDFDGHQIVMGLLPSDQGRLMATHPQSYEDVFDVIPRNQWPDKVSHKKFFPYIFNQNGFGACGGMGATGSYTAKWIASGKKQQLFSPTYLYSLCNGGRDRGSIPEDLDEAMRTKGICLQSTVDMQRIYRHQYDVQKADAEASRFKTEQTYRVTTVAGIVSALIRNHMLFDGIWCGPNYEPKSDGVLPEYQGGGGGHCMARLGYEIRNGRIFFEKPNSWGTRWGQGGWCWEPQSYIEAGLRDFACIAIVSCLEDPQDTIAVR